MGTTQGRRRGQQRRRERPPSTPEPTPAGVCNPVGGGGRDRPAVALARGGTVTASLFFRPPRRGASVAGRRQTTTRGGPAPPSLPPRPSALPYRGAERTTGAHAVAAVCRGGSPPPPQRGGHTLGQTGSLPAQGETEQCGRICPKEGGLPVACEVHSGPFACAFHLLYPPPVGRGALQPSTRVKEGMREREQRARRGVVATEAHCAPAFHFPDAERVASSPDSCR